MTRAELDVRGPEIAIHGPARRALAVNIPVTGGTLSTPALTMKTRGGDPYTKVPGVGTAAMAGTQTLRLAWSAADMAALNTGPRPVEYRFEVVGVPAGLAAAQVLTGILTVYPTTWGRAIPANELGTLVLNGAPAISLAVTVPPPDGPLDGGYMGDAYGGTTGFDEGLFTDPDTDTTTYDGGSF